MTLGLALSNALSGLNVNQNALATTSNNITNANTDGYSRKTVNNTTQVVAGKGVGANPEVKRIVDEFLTKAQRGQSTATAGAQVRQEFMTRLQAYIGKPGEEASGSIATQLDSFFSAMSNVSANPEQPFFRTQAVQSGVSLANSISLLAENIQRTRFEAEQEIGDTVTEINQQLDTLNVINKALRESYVNGQSQEELLDQRDEALRQLTKNLDVGVSFRQSGEVSLFNQAGELLSGARYKIKYSPAGSVNTLINDKELGKMEIVALNEDGFELDYRIELSSGGKSSEITTKLQDGKLKGLMDIRDIELPKMIEQLDSLAATLRDELNKIQNDGVGYPPPSTLTGTKQIRLDQEVGFNGSVQIAAVSSAGKPLASGYANDLDRKLRPLTINFDEIYGPNGKGRPTTADIVNEINQFYGAPANRASMGPLADARLVAVSDNTTGPFQFTMEFDNPSANGLTISIVSINATAVGDGVTVNAGEVKRSNAYTIAGAGPYSIDVEIQLTDPETGDVYNDTITYSIPAAASGLRGDRYEVASLAGGVSPPMRGGIVTPDHNDDYIIARMVDINGDVVTDPTQPAFLQLLGNNGGRIAINELNSKEVGLANAGTSATGRGFSHFFQLNNLFVENPETTPGSSAKNLRVRQDIINNPNLLSVGELSLSKQPTGENTKPIYTYEIGIASNQISELFSAMRTTSVSFAAAGNLPAFTNSLSDYTAEIYASIGGAYNTADNAMRQQEILEKSYADRLSSVSGVNLDEELANTVLFQNAYSASARIITVVSTLFDTLLNIRQ